MFFSPNIIVGIGDLLRRMGCKDLREIIMNGMDFLSVTLTSYNKFTRGSHILPDNSLFTEYYNSSINRNKEAVFCGLRSEVETGYLVSCLKIMTSCK